MMSEAIESFFKFQKPTVDRNYLQETIMVFENGDNIATYFIKKELRSYIKAVIREILTNPEKLKNIQEKTIEYNRRLFKKNLEADRIKYEKQSDQRLIKIFYELIEIIQLSHGYALATTWFVDADGEDLSKYLLNFLKEKIRRKELQLNAPEVFSVLTSPAEESLALKEEKEMLGILALIMNNSPAAKIFKKENLIKLEDNLKKIDRSLYKKIIAHYKKWRWTPYAYIGPAYNLDYYLSIWSSLVRQKIKPLHEIEKLTESKEKIISQRKQIIKSLELNKKETAIFNLAAQIVWLKSFRKDALFQAMYVVDKVLKELGRRYGFSLMQMKYIASQEMKNFKKFSADELNQRFKFSVIYCRLGKIKIYAGKQARDFLKNKSFEKIIINKSDELKGTAAFVGKVKGRVKIINLPEEMNKMEKGNIMVSHTTFPSLVPAMKKAAAIVTDDGGITCHAAIVARELRIPCVVGTKFATKVLKDDDLVEVDAEQGIIKKINKI